MTVTLCGFRYSIYRRIAVMALAEKGVEWQAVEVDPFGDLPEGYRDLHPFGLVPVLEHDGFRIYETAAITRYIDLAFDGPGLVPKGARAAARMAQAIAVADAYGYWPLVRQVFAHRVFAPAEGGVGDAGLIGEGLDKAQVVLGALEVIAAEGLVLNAQGVTLADIHLAPMIGAFVQAPEGAAMLADYPALSRWWGWVSRREAYLAGDPGLPVTL